MAPRFDGRIVDGQPSPSFEEVRAVLKGLPCLPQNATIYGDNNDRRVVQFPLLPKADCDLGDVAKALGKLGGDKKKPVAVISLAKQVPITEKQFDTLRKELAAAKGINWENSGRWNGKGAPQATGFIGELALDEAGGAKFMEIRAACKKAGITLLRDGVDDK